MDEGPTGLQVWLDDADSPLELSWFWVRDHSEDKESFDPTNRQRQVDTFALDRTWEPKQVSVVDDAVCVEWANGAPTSILTAPTLASLTPAPSRSRLWRSAVDIDPRFVLFEDVMHSDAGLRAWLKSIARDGFGLVRDVPTDRESAEALASRIGYVRRTVFGDVWKLTSEVAEFPDSAYGNATLEPHTDGSYSHDGPGLQLFACCERTGTGGESIMVDGFAAAEQLREADPAAFDLLTAVSVPAQYIDDDVHIRASRPAIILDVNDAIRQVTFNNYDRAPFLLPPAEMIAWYDAYSAFHDLLVDESAWWTHRLEPGDALMFDNWRCLHGRLEYTGLRVFHGCYLNHEDLESRLRVTS